jgi:hypothetical protein
LTVRQHFASLGDVAILIALGSTVAGTLTYCFTRSAPYSHAQVESPTFAFDYVLYLGCLAFAAGLGYVEYRFGLLQDAWDFYLLMSAVVYFLLAYRFDNRLVLSLALSTLAAWFGVRLSMWHFMPDAIRGLAIPYGLLVSAIGYATARAGVKAHFIDAYLHVGANAVLLSLFSGAAERGDATWWLIGLLAASAVAVVAGIRNRRFAFVVYGVVYAYFGVTAQITHYTRGETELLAYYVVSSATVLAALVIMSRSLGREE